MILYDYFRSSASYRVRIALNIKNLAYDKVEVHLTQDGGQQHQEAYLGVNPQGLVPSLEIHGQILSQSLAIIEYLDEAYPKPPLLPQDLLAKAKVRSLALSIACDIHPINNLRVLNRLKSQFAADEAAIRSWYHHWLQVGFTAFEAQLRSLERSQEFCCGDSVSLADICLIPQVYNAHRFELPMQNYPLITAIYDSCMLLEAFQQAKPES